MSETTGDLDEVLSDEVRELRREVQVLRDDQQELQSVVRELREGQEHLEVMEPEALVPLYRYSISQPEGKYYRLSVDPQLAKPWINETRLGNVSTTATGIVLYEFQNNRKSEFYLYGLGTNIPPQGYKYTGIKFNVLPPGTAGLLTLYSIFVIRYEALYYSTSAVDCPTYIGCTPGIPIASIWA